VDVSKAQTPTSTATLTLTSELDCSLTIRDVKESNIQLGEGSYGETIEVEYTGTDLAAHYLQIDNSISLESFKKSLLQECLSWSRASRHPNIVQFVGLWYRDGDNSVPLLVTEKMRYSLRSLIENREDVSVHQKMLLLHDVSKGLCYLHSRNPTVVHGGLLPYNILLGCSSCCMKAKITNVGVAKVITIPDNSFDSRFLPPKTQKYESPFDIFCFGKVFWYTFELPESGKSCIMNFQDVLHKPLNEKMLEDLRPLVTSCWNHSPDERPSIAMLSKAIKDVISKETLQVGIVVCM